MAIVSNTNTQPLVPLLQVKDKNIALLFSHYLQTKGLQVELEYREAEGHIILCYEDDIEKVKAEFEEFIANPQAKKYQQAAWNSGETIKLSSEDFTLINSFKDKFLAHAGPVTLIVFALCWFVFLGSELGWAQELFNQLHFYPELTLDAFFAEPIRLIGPAFFHFSWLHIVFNTMWWWQLGGSIEQNLGKMTLINLLFISAIVSNAGQFLVTGANFGGLSGVVYALVGFVWWMGYLAPERGLSLSKSIISFLLLWLLVGFADLLPVNMANTAHLLGLLSGCLIALVTVKVIGLKARK